MGKKVSKITVYFHLYDFLERGRKTPTTENSTGLPGAVSEGEIMARRDQQEAGFFLVGGDDSTVLYPDYDEGYTTHMHILKFIDMYTTKGQFHCIMF